MKVLVLALLLAVPAIAAEAPFKKVFIVVLENTNFKPASERPFLKQLGKEGVVLTNYYAVRHPSQPNYIAMIAGDTMGCTSDKTIDIDATHLGDLLEAKGKTWKVYAEAYPGGCFLGAKHSTYVRKHVPFLSFKNVQQDPKRCANIVDASQLKKDIAKGTLPDYSLYIPDMNNDGHDTGISFADRYMAKRFGKLLLDPRFTKDLLFVLTFDEDNGFDNRVYTVAWGDRVKHGTTYDVKTGHYGLLRTIEDAFGLGTLGRNDETAQPFSGIWQEIP